MENAESYPLVSVIIPTHNRAPLLRDAIRSVMAQTYSPLEIIIADDGSTDDSRAVVAALNSHLIRLLALPHCGHPGILRNRGASVATGSLFAFLDSDDLWLPRKLETQVNALRQSGAQWCFGAFTHFKEMENDVHYSGHDSGEAATGIIPPASITDSLLLNQKAAFIGTLLLTRKAFDRLGGFNETAELRFRGDYEFVLRLSLKETGVEIPSLLTLVREHDKRSTGQLDNAYLFTSRVYDVFLKSSAPASLRRLAKRRKAWLLSEAAASAKNKMDRGRRMRLLRRSFLHDGKLHWLHALFRSLRR